MDGFLTMIAMGIITCVMKWDKNSCKKDGNKLVGCHLMTSWFDEIAEGIKYFVTKVQMSQSALSYLFATRNMWRMSF
jgi:hypothetical protein